MLFVSILFITHEYSSFIFLLWFLIRIIIFTYFWKSNKKASMRKVAALSTGYFRFTSMSILKSYAHGCLMFPSYIKRWSFLARWIYAACENTILRPDLIPIQGVFAKFDISITASGPGDMLAGPVGSLMSTNRKIAPYLHHDTSLLIKFMYF